MPVVIAAVTKTNTIWENAALIGLFGVALGAFMTLAGNLLQTFNNNRHSKIMFIKQNELERIKEINELKRNAYVNFLNLLGQKRLLIHTRGKNIDDVYNETKRNMSENVNQIMSVFSLVAPPKLLKMGVELFNECGSYIDDDLYDEQYGNLIAEMKKDLGIEEK